MCKLAQTSSIYQPSVEDPSRSPEVTLIMTLSDRFFYFIKHCCVKLCCAILQFMYINLYANG